MTFDTDTLVWNSTKKRYYITPSGVKNVLNKDLKKELGSNNVSGITEEDVFIQRVGDTIMRWVWHWVQMENRATIQEWIEEDKNLFGISFREAIEEASYAQALYMITFDGDLEAVANGDMNKLVSMEAQSILKQSGVAWSGTIPYSLR